VVSWCKTSKTDVQAVMRLRGDPFYTRPLGIDGTVSDAMFAQAVTPQFGLDEAELTDRVIEAYTRAARNDRGMRYAVPSRDSINNSPYDALPLRSAVRAPLTDGAVVLVLASEQFVDANPDCKPWPGSRGAGGRPTPIGSALTACARSSRRATAWASALRQAGRKGAAELDAIELESPTPFHEAAYVRAFGIETRMRYRPPAARMRKTLCFCTGLVNAAEAVLQVSGKAGPVQRRSARWAAAHSCHGLRAARQCRRRVRTCSGAPS
jgi:acetyl-CoA acetyltransferase